jgi:hypothetical protein
MGALAEPDRVRALDQRLEEGFEPAAPHVDEALGGQPADTEIGVEERFDQGRGGAGIADLAEGLGSFPADVLVRVVQRLDQGRDGRASWDRNQFWPSSWWTSRVIC